MASCAAQPYGCADPPADFNIDSFSVKFGCQSDTIRCAGLPDSARPNVTLSTYDRRPPDVVSFVPEQLAPVFTVSRGSWRDGIGSGADGGFRMGSGTVSYALSIFPTTRTDLVGARAEAYGHHYFGALSGEDYRTYSGTGFLEACRAVSCGDGPLFLFGLSLYGASYGTSVRSCNVCSSKTTLNEDERRFWAEEFQPAIYDPQAFQDGGFAHSATIVASSGFYDGNRPAGGLSDSGNQSTISKLLYLSLHGQILPIPRDGVGLVQGFIITN